MLFDYVTSNELCLCYPLMADTAVAACLLPFLVVVPQNCRAVLAEGCKKIDTRDQRVVVRRGTSWGLWWRGLTPLCVGGLSQGVHRAAVTGNVLN